MATVREALQRWGAVKLSESVRRHYESLVSIPWVSARQTQLAEERVNFEPLPSSVDVKFFYREGDHGPCGAEGCSCPYRSPSTLEIHVSGVDAVGRRESRRIPLDSSFDFEAFVSEVVAAAGGSITA